MDEPYSARRFTLPMTSEAGILFMIATTAAFAGSDATVKIIGSSVPLLVLLFVRYLFQAAVLGVWQIRRGTAPFHNMGSVKLQAIRAIMLLLNSAFMFAGIRHLPLPINTALAMTAPLITTVLAATVLNEAVPRSKWSMVILGFIGMLMVVRPGSSEFSLNVIFPIGAATTFACFQVASSSLSKTGDAVTTNFLTALIATAILSLILLADQATVLPQIRGIGFDVWSHILLMAFLATLGQMLMLQAMRRTSLALLTPFGYGQLAFATLFSWILFARVPDLWTAIGMAVITAGGVGMVLLQTRRTA